ncbi:MAG: chemotaxis protein CheX [Spirochaetaceae bacterium]|jgi:chemotaxis protein CheX|nr:chemotaxis protein CheX [Spirochaetaceae bacterium]
MERYIQPFIDVSKAVFKKFLNADIVAGRPHFSDQASYPNWDISGVIGLTGEARGAVVISMKKDLAIKLTQILTEQEHNDFDDEVVDSVGEIINIIAGNVKHGLENTFRLVISLPTVVNGDNHTIQWPQTNARIICIPFKIFNDKSFYISVAIEALNSGKNGRF